MYMTPVIFITLACLSFSRSSEDEENSRMAGRNMQSAMDKVMNIVQSVAGRNPAAESTAGNGGSLISQSGGPTESLSSTAGPVTPDYAVVNPKPVQSPGSNVKIPESGCCCMDYIREFCEG